MQPGFVRAIAGMLAGLAVASCAVSDARRQDRREALARNIVDDAIAYNEAYSGAISGQILLNILRAYNRQPRQYMSMSGFANSSPGTRTGAVSIGGLPLDQLGQAWGEGSVVFGAEQRLAPDYTVQPFDTDAFANIALTPTSPDVFHHYWHTGWNRDLLLLLLVERMDVTSANGAVETLYNSAGTIDADCVGDQYNFGGCLFVRAARELAQTTRATPLPPQRGAGAPACPPIARYGPEPATPVVLPEIACPVMVVVGDRRYTLTLRSLDNMVYYVGELLRQNELAPDRREAGVMVARLGVIGPGYYRPEDRVPLFRVTENDGGDAGEYSATVSYAGRRYSAGAPMSRFCYDPPPGERCRGGALSGDRSGTVLELLSGVLAYNQNEAAISAPDSAIINTR